MTNNKRFTRPVLQKDAARLIAHFCRFGLANDFRVLNKFISRTCTAIFVDMPSKTSFLSRNHNQ